MRCDLDILQKRLAPRFFQWLRDQISSFIRGWTDPIDAGMPTKQ
jgi:hypothetical protein